jgi:hypothetical protein
MNKPDLGRHSVIPRFSHRAYRSYTNNPARELETCQAAFAAKNRDCRIKTHLPRFLVHKSGNALQCGTPGLHVCTQTLSSPSDLGEHHHDAPDRQWQET